MDSVEPIFRNVLIVSGETESLRLIQEVLASKAIRATVERDGRVAAQKVEDARWDLVMAEAKPSGGREILRASKRHFPERPVVLFGRGEPLGDVVDVMREGCDDFLSSPLSSAAVADVLDTLLPNHDVPLAAGAEEESRCLYRMAGRGEAFLRTVRLAKKIAPTSVPVLITGESGTGKELLSYLIHDQSNRSHGPYIRVNCASLSETLLESELFGHERGAFTGAVAQRKGRFERAHGGTLLLDEISETGPRLQADLLRVLEQQDFERLGGSEVVRVNVRVIATTNRDLAHDVELGRFRRDLYYRINGVNLHVPPLRQRKDDLPALVWHFVNLYACEVRRQITRLAPAMLAAFREYHWPGTIRQLRNVVRTAMVLGEGPTLSLDGAGSLLGELEPTAAAPVVPAVRATTTLSLQELERQAILEALERSQRNQAKAARLLGITDRTLREKLRRYRQADETDAAAAAETPTVREMIW